MFVIIHNPMSVERNCACHKHAESDSRKVAVRFEIRYDVFEWGWVFKGKGGKGNCGIVKVVDLRWQAHRLLFCPKFLQTWPDRELEPLHCRKIQNQIYCRHQPQAAIRMKALSSENLRCTYRCPKAVQKFLAVPNQKNNGLGLDIPTRKFLWISSDLGEIDEWMD